MPRSKALLILALNVLASSAFAQLHLITGAPFTAGAATYPSILLRIGEKGDVAAVAGIVHSTVGTQWIGASYDLRKAVFVSSKEDTIVVLDFDRAAVVKKCSMPEIEGNALIHSWLSDPPALGPSYERFEVGSDVRNDVVVRRMVLDPTIPCEKSISAVEPEEIRYAVAHGKPGIADIVNSDGIRTNTNRGNGNVTAFTYRVVPLGFQVPQALLRGFHAAAEGMPVNDSHVFVLSMGNRSGDYRILLFRKSDKTWHALPNALARGTLRGFGRYLAVAEERPKTARNPTSAGMEKWEASNSPDLREAIKNTEPHVSVVYPGKLHLYDVETGRVYTTTTNQGDSEVLLVENDTVYYRAADQLFSRPITSKGLGPARLLATDDLIRDAHWAFIKH